MDFKLLSKETQDRVMRLRDMGRNGLEICMERGKYFTESFKETEAFPSSYRKATALVHLLENKTVKIWDDELIVGAITSEPLGMVLMPEINATWFKELVEDLESAEEAREGGKVSEADKKTLKEIADVWTGKCLTSRWWAALPQEAKDINEIVIGGGAYCANGQNFGHFALDYETILFRGIKAYIADIEAAKTRLTDLGDPEQFDAYNLYNNMLMELRALIQYAHRYSDLAKSMAEAEVNPKRKAELLKIAEVCAWVPENTPRDFQEALQAELFIFEAIELETFSHAGSLGRVDQAFYPYYKMSKEKGMTDEEAFLLYAAFIIKEACAFQCPPLGRNSSMFGQKLNMGGGGMVCTIGGTDREGRCAVNELSYLILDVEHAVGFSNDVMIRVNANTPDDFMLKAARLARDLCGKSKFLGDATITNQMRFRGHPDSEIGNYCVVGCHAPCLPSCTLEISGGIINLPLIFDSALHDGYAPMLKKQMGPHTGDPRNFTGWEQVFEAFKTQYKYFMPYIHIISNVDKRLNGLYNPTPIASAFYPECVEKGKDLYCGALGKRTSYAFSLGGAPNVSDALVALKKLVYEDKKLTIAQVLDACDRNFEGEEDARVLALLNKAPKYGNDDDYADKMLNEVLSFASDATCAAPGEWGSVTTVAGAAVALNILHGTRVGAQPDGRRAGTPITEGGLSPNQGRNINGATATCNSLLKLPHMKLHHGEVLNMRFDPAMLATEENLKKFAIMIKSFLVAGGYLIQFNIVSTAMLKDAQAHPENYQDLLVRVATYSSYFVALTKDLQDDIINRGELSL